MAFHQWKASTLETYSGYRRQFIDGAIKAVFIDALNDEHVAKWFADLNNRTGPGATNRTFKILKNMLNKAEVWGYQLENANPCRSIRPSKRRQCDWFLSVEEQARLGEVLAILLAGCRYRERLHLR
jgi:hypothetical protein